MADARETYDAMAADYVAHVEARFWHRPLSAMLREIAEAGWRVDALSEPQPLPEMRERFPEAWERLTTKPHFLVLRLVPAAGHPRNLGL